jgi:hypothetical protein
MATEKIPNSPGNRLKAGDRILERAGALDAAPIAAQLAAFESTHRLYSAKARLAEAAEARLEEAEEKLGEADAAQDAAVESLAGALAGAAFSRTQPFKAFGAPAPSKLKDLTFSKQAAALRKLALAVAKKAPAAKQAARHALGCVDGVERAERPLKNLASKAEASRAARDALGRTWLRALNRLKTAARYADSEHHTRLFEALFGGAPSHREPLSAPPPSDGEK